MDQGYEKDELDAAYRSGYQHGVEAAEAELATLRARVAKLEAQLTAAQNELSGTEAAWEPFIDMMFGGDEVD